MIKNPILTGFSPDPSIIRAGGDYYIATSTFEWWPGVKLFHSTDLQNWEQIPSPLREPSQLDLEGDPTSGGVWAPCLSYDGEYYYLVYTDVKTKKGRFYNTHNYLVYARDIYGPWSEPVYLNSIGFDPSLFHDTDGRKYLINMVNGFKGILVQEIEPGSFKFIGERRKVYDGSGIGCTEGPHMYHIGDWYYLIVAEGGTGYEHCVTLARSQSVWGPFETMPGNPVLASNPMDMSTLQKCGHADIVDTPEGDWYMVHLCSRPLKGQKWCTLGRETAIEKVYWDSEGWLRLANGGQYPDIEVECDIPDAGKCFSEELIEDFDEGTIPVSMSSPRIPYYSFADTNVRKGYVRIYGRESMNSLHKVSLLATRQRHFNVEVTTGMEFEPTLEQQMAGLTYMYDAMNFFLLAKTVSPEGKTQLVLLKSDQGVITDEASPVTIDNKGKIELRVEVTDEGTIARFSYRMAGCDEWTYIGGPQSTDILTDEYCRGFTGAHFGIYAHDMAGLGSYADFDYLYVREK